MADKRKKTKRRRRRRRRGGTPAALILLCLVVAAAAILTATTVFFKVRDIRLSGSTRYSLAEITEASGLKTGDNLILFDKFSAIDRIFAACPYLDTVQMRRRLPDTIEITVTDCVPRAPSGTPAAGGRSTAAASCWSRCRRISWARSPVSGA